MKLMSRKNHLFSCVLTWHTCNPCAHLPFNFCRILIINSLRILYLSAELNKTIFFYSYIHAKKFSRDVTEVLLNPHPPDKKNHKIWILIYFFRRLPLYVLSSLYMLLLLLYNKLRQYVDFFSMLFSLLF